jgi:hypothetical protein
MLGLHGDRLDVLHRTGKVAGRGAEVGAIVQEDVFPVGLVVGRLFGFGLLLDRRDLGFLLGRDQLGEGVAEQLMLQVLLEVEERAA